MDYRWIPGMGPDAERLARMAAHAKRPREPMGEAWFMGDAREMYTYLLDTHLDRFTDQQLEQPLVEIASGTCAFGMMDEWQQWFDYLLPALVPLALARCRSALHELLVNAFIAQHPNGVAERAHGRYRDDVLLTLGRYLMDARHWHDGKAALSCILHPAPGPQQQTWGWKDASGDLSASLFLCLKYLRPEEIDGWIGSVFAIDDPHWRAQILVWLVGSRPLMDGSNRYPNQTIDLAPSVAWEWSWCHTGADEQAIDGQMTPFIALENAAAFKASVAKLLRETLTEWRASIAAIDYLAFEALPCTADLESLFGLQR